MSFNKSDVESICILLELYNIAVFFNFLLNIIIITVIIIVANSALKCCVDARKGVYCYKFSL